MLFASDNTKRRAIHVSSIYESPEAELVDRDDYVDYKLFKISGIGLATFFGSAFAGGILLGLNFKRLGNDGAAQKAYIFSLLATLVIIGGAMFIPEDVPVPNVVFTVIQLFAMLQISKHFQGADIETHIANNGEIESNWKAFGISLLVLLALLAIIFVLTFIFLI
jgi:hypothetical protein